MPCRALLLARLSTIQGRYSLMRLHMIGRRDTRGIRLHNGIRCCCMRVKRMRSKNGHLSPGWDRSDHLNNWFSLSPSLFPHLSLLHSFPQYFPLFDSNTAFPILVFPLAGHGFLSSLINYVPLIVRVNNILTMKR